MTWSAVCLVAPYSQFGDGARPHGRVKTPYTSPQAIEPVVSSFQDVLGRLIPSGLKLNQGMKARTIEVLTFHLCFIHCFTRMSSLDKLPNSFHAAGANWRLDLSLSRCASCCPTNCPCGTWSGSWIARFAKESIALNRWSSAGCLRRQESPRLVWDASI